MKKEELLKICMERNEIDLLFRLTKIVAETDSIGEGYGYCAEYTMDKFSNEIKEDDNWSNYLDCAGLPIYEAYLKHLGVI